MKTANRKPHTTNDAKESEQYTLLNRAVVESPASVDEVTVGSLARYLADALLYLTKKSADHEELLDLVDAPGIEKYLKVGGDQ